MPIPVTITYRHMDVSPAIEDAVHKYVAKLEQVCGDILQCRVTLEAPHRHHQQGNLFQVGIEVSVPGKDIVVNRAPSSHQAHEDAYVALRDAFQAARRKLRRFARVRQGNVKTHEPPSHGRVRAVDPERGFGFIETPDNREIYFHRNSLIGVSLEALDVGTELRFVEHAGEKGPQASSVTVVGKHHPVP